MKAIKYVAAISLLIAGCMVSYWAGYNAQNGKNYEAACLQADFIRYAIDHFNGETEMANIGAEIEESYYEYFQDMENYGTDQITSVKDFEEYGWCY
jgi:hypothetical protein